MNRAAIGAALAVLAGSWWFMGRARAATPGAYAAGSIGGIADLVEDAIGSITPGQWEPPSRAAPYLELIREAEHRHDLPHNLVARVIYQETRFREDIINGTVRSPAGAIGIGQFMPATAAELGIDPLNVAQAIDAVGRYLRWLYNTTGDWPRAIAAYNWGIGNVQRRGLDQAPNETRDYVAGVAGDLGLA